MTEAEKQKIVKIFHIGMAIGGILGFWAGFMFVEIMDWLK